MSSALKGENCTFIHVRGIKTLETWDGVDLLKSLKGGARESVMDVDKTMMNLLNRVDALEYYELLKECMSYY